MPTLDDIPDLTHWKTVQEFSIEQAALLLAGIDPLDFLGGIEEARKLPHPRWKDAWGFASGMVSAIRRGVLSVVKCVSEETIWENGVWGGECVVVYEEMKPTDRSKEVSKIKTIITRDSLFCWTAQEKVHFVSKPKPIIPYQSVKTKTINPNHFSAPPSRALLETTHRSEGLEFVDDAINQFWLTYDENDPNTAPSKSEIVTYLERKGASNNIAQAVDLILRPFTLRNKGRPKKRQ
ncbi:hypothetical protein [Candidatus Regiella endosymbiont of Tuberolachnus salignus]|uniref:hypothetical protein n=1 Tax=Candidatus Regiella endosymbiont of Tuberolachnus salignus TaxID=3077956 RepID=UPI0030CAAC7F